MNRGENYWRKRVTCMGLNKLGAPCGKHQNKDARDGQGGWLIRDGMVYCEQHRQQAHKRPLPNGITIAVNGVTITVRQGLQ